jgi:ribosomal protein S19
MGRSKWKIKNIFFSSNGFFIKKFINDSNKKNLIIESYLNKTINTYNGKSFKKLNLTNEKLGYKVGEFCFTRVVSKSKKKFKK